MDQYTTHAQTRSTDEISDNTIKETTTGKDKTEYDNDSVNASAGLEDFSDGGLRAWLIIGGVSQFTDRRSLDLTTTTCYFPDHVQLLRNVSVNRIILVRLIRFHGPRVGFLNAWGESVYLFGHLKVTGSSNSTGISGILRRDLVERLILPPCEYSSLHFSNASINELFSAWIGSVQVPSTTHL